MTPSIYYLVSLPLQKCMEVLARSDLGGLSSHSAQKIETALIEEGGDKKQKNGERKKAK